MKTLEDWGWDDTWAKMFAEYDNEGWTAARIVSPGRGVFRITAGKDARLTGRALNRGTAPAAGDWVAWREEGGSAVIGAVLPRRTVISRKAAGDTSREQIMGVNVDVLFVVQALGSGRGFNLRGLERYLSMAWESGCRPVVVLNKADLSENLRSDITAAGSTAPGVGVFACSTLTGEGLEAVRSAMAPGLTGAFVGPSGVGKSSIINALAGYALAETGGIREHDSRGRHTTTRRELHLLDDGRILLDTPGLRELQLWGETGSADAAFPEIEELAGKCRFRDCRHETEPGCAVRAGLEDGSVEPGRFESWQSLRGELSWLEARRDDKARRELEKKWIDIARINRNAKNGREVW